jgi:hypothetical protein
MAPRGGTRGDGDMDGRPSTENPQDTSTGGGNTTTGATNPQ